MNSIFEYLNQNINDLIEDGKILDYHPYQYLEYLSNSLYSYNFQDDFSYLVNIFPIISYLLYTPKITKSDKQKMADLLRTIREQIQILILQKPGDIPKEHPNFMLLKTLINHVESFMIASLYDFMNRYQGNSLALMEYLLFELKDYNLIQGILTQYPYMIRLRDKEDVSLFQKVLSNYIQEVYVYTDNKELSTNFNLIYYDKIISLFLNHPKLEFSFKEKMDVISHINYCRKNMNSDHYNSLTKRKFVFWLNHLEEKLQDDDHQITMKEICYMYDIKNKFDEGILSEARRLNKEIKTSRYPNRKIIDDEYILTIDGEGAQELDDGISIKKMENGYYRLGVHIADPTGMIPRDNVILDGAYERGTSIYLSQTIFMFPEVLSKDKMNLLENKYRLATSYYLYINEDGNIENYEFLETIIKVSKNTTYSEVNKVLSSGGCEDIDYLTTVCLLSEVVQKLKKNFTIDKTYALINRTVPNSTNTNIIENTNATRIVEVSMMMANHIVPYHMNKNSLPCIYRIHTIDEEYLKKLSSISESIYSYNNKDVDSIIRYLKAIYPKAKYSTDAKEHFGLGLKYYSHVTSPLRRYIDDAMKLYVLDPFYFHRISDKEAYLIEEKLNKICKHINEKNIIVDSFMESYSKSKVKILTKD